MLTFEQIKELMELVRKHRLAGLEVERAGFKLKIQADGGGQAPRAAAGSAPPAEQPAAAPSAEPEPAAAAEPVPAAAEEHHLLRSPIVGTFYAAPSPDSDPYVQIGDRVKKGQVLCIVEAMKLMNEIESDVDGELVEIFPKNAQPVEFGEQLFAIRPR